MLDKMILNKNSVVRSGDVQESETLPRNLPHVVAPLHKGRQVRDPRSDVLDALSQLGQESVDVPNVAQRVVDGEVHLRLVSEGQIDVIGGQGGIVAGDGGFDLGLAGSDHSGVEVDCKRVCMSGLAT